MGDLSATCTYTICEPGYALKKLLIETVATADGADTIALTLADYGISDMMSIRTIIESTAGSVFAASTSTTTISAGVLTITLGTGTNKKYNIFIEGK
jgi:hypothetical protein